MTIHEATEQVREGEEYCRKVWGDIPGESRGSGYVVWRIGSQLYKFFPEERSIPELVLLKDGFKYRIAGQYFSREQFIAALTVMPL